MAKRNFIDSFVSFISPVSGARRAKARMLENIYERGYDGASRGRRTDYWYTAGADPNVELTTAGKTLRERARDLVRNNPFAARAVQGIVSNTIGYGIQGSPLVNKAENKQVTELWEKWALSTACDFSGRHDFYGLQAIIQRALVQDGECLIRRVIRKPTDENPLPLQIMVLEIDFLDTSKDTKPIVQGVEFDSTGKRIAYWLFDNHPGSNQGTSYVSKRVPAEEVIHVYRADRPGQERGASWFAPVMLTMHDLDRFMDASLHKQMVAAAFSIFIEDATDPEITPGTDTSQTPMPEKLEPGMIELLPPGKKISFPNNPAAGDFEPFVRATLGSVAMGMGITRELLTGDLSALNFSSGRMGWIEFHKNIEVWRWHLFIPQVCEGVGRWFAEATALISDVKAETFSWGWTPPRREQIDPTTETKAAILQIRAGLKSYDQVVREQGDDPKRTLEEIAEHNKTLDKLELVLDSDPRSTMQSGGLQQVQEEEAPGAEEEELPEKTEADQAKFFEDQSGQLWKKTDDGFEKIEA